MIRQVFIHLFDYFGIVGPGLVEPEYGRRTGESGATHRQFYPILDWCILDLAHTPDIARFDAMFQQHRALAIHYLHLAIAGDLKSLVVGTILFGLLRHQAHVRHAAHGGGIEGTISLAEIDHLLVNTGVASIGNNRLHIVELAVGSPHLPGCAYGCRH